MELKTYFAQDAAGNIISSAIVNVFLQGTTTLATGLTRADGTPLENPFAADGAGRIQFRAPDGYYDVQVSAGPGIIQTLTIQCVDYSGAKADADRAEAAADRSDVSAEQAQNALNSITGINTNFEKNSREQWRRTLADAGFNLVDGSFEEGATAQSVNDAVWHIAGGACYSWGGNLPKSVTEESTPEVTGGISTGAWNDLKSQTLRSQLGSNSGVSIVGGLEERLSLVDISKVSGTKDSAMLNSIFSAYRGRNVTLYSSVALTFNIDTDVTAYGNFDFSNLTFNLSGGRVIYADEREISEYKKTINLTNYPLVELTSVLPSSDVLEGWENSLVKIVSPTEVDLYRLLNGVSSPRYKGEVNFMSKAGELVYTLKNTYNDAVTCTLYKLPNKRNKIVLPRFTGQFSRYAFNIQRSLVDVEVVYFNDMGMTATDSNIFGSSTTYGVNWRLTSVGITQTDNNSRYTLSMEYVLKHTFTGCEVGKGWRSIDGNYCRDVVVRDSNIDSFHMHYGCSKILVDNCRIPGGILVGTGAFDEATQIINSHIGPFGVRTDYGEHKGDFIVRGGGRSYSRGFIRFGGYDFVSFRQCYRVREPCPAAHFTSSEEYNCTDEYILAFGSNTQHFII